MSHTILTHYSYIMFLILSLSGITFADWRMRLVFFDNPKAGFKAVLGLMALLLAADFIGIGWRVFYTNPKYVTGIFIEPNLPIEEIFFLFLLSYFTLLVYAFIKRRGHV